MPQIAMEPIKHWNFRATPANIDVGRALSESFEAGATVVRIRAKFTKGVKPYLFVRYDSDDAKALPPLWNAVKGHGIGLTDGTPIKYTPNGFALEAMPLSRIGKAADPEVGQWIVISGDKSIEVALELIRRQRELLKRRQRVTVECL
jgi:hypothetical protein